MGMFEGRRAMLIDGVILEEGPMNPPHAITLELVEEALRGVFGAGWRIRSQSPLVLGQDIDPEPDFAVIAGAVRGSVGHPTTANLVIEVADSSLAFDTNEKRLLYAKSAIPEYWVVDINNQKLLVYRDPTDGDYLSRQSLTTTDSVVPLCHPSSIAIADFF
jgi:Uma2 family endonuclease